MQYKDYYKILGVKREATEEDIKAERDKLTPEDRKRVDEQDACPIMPDNRLGVMGPPIKVKLKDQQKRMKFTASVVKS